MVTQMSPLWRLHEGWTQPGSHMAAVPSGQETHYCDASPYLLGPMRVPRVSMALPGPDPDPAPWGWPGSLGEGFRSSQGLAGVACGLCPSGRAAASSLPWAWPALH